MIQEAISLVCGAGYKESNGMMRSGRGIIKEGRKGRWGEGRWGTRMCTAREGAMFSHTMEYNKGDWIFVYVLLKSIA